MADQHAKADSRTSYSEWERPLFEAWRDQGYFQRTEGFGPHGDETYTVVIPPPNITGVLHMGHALNDTIQDACVRRARMRGYKTRWILGTDHAGIATQAKVDRELAQKGINRREIGREAFIAACQDWREQYGTTIVKQIAAMGCSCDYADEQFTMSPSFSAAVRKVFVDWYRRGIIYRGKRIVNWCPHCTTAIADDEAEYEDEAGKLWYFRYPLTEPAPDGRTYLVVATTRPETMLGDTGVAVNPSDERYRDLVGKTVMLPLVNREIPIFADHYVDSSFGTGAVKVTPAHDPNDFAMGARAGLEVINVLDENAVIVEGYGRYSGMDRDEARQAIIEDFEAAGLLDRIEDHDHSVMHCYRCHTTLEPWLSEQWFVSVDQLKAQAAEVVESDRITFYPPRWKAVYLDWLANLKDWCISRQLWWGHRIPMYYCDECGWQDASVDEVETCPVCGQPTRQDEDVLDTWFSSQLWPFATQGWAAGELDSSYPTQMLSTARDIMGLWVARMVMASMDETGQIPFEDVIIHPTVMGADGKPMSKSRGNGVDPMVLMADYGADGMRFGLLLSVTGAQAMRFDVKKVESSRNFANKIRNAARFVTMNLDGFTPGPPQPRTTADRWILGRLAALAHDVDVAFDAYEFGEVTRRLYEFFWSEFCDWYVEFSKSRLNGDAAERLSCQRNLMFVLLAALRLLHPIMPFVTEEIYQGLPDKPFGPYLIGALWPTDEELAIVDDPSAERTIAMVCSIITAVRSARSRYQVSPKQLLEVHVKATEADRALLEAERSLIESQAKSHLTISERIERAPESIMSADLGLEIAVDLAGLVDFDAERARLEKSRAKLAKDLASLEKKLANEGYRAKAAAEIIAKDEARLGETKEKLAAVEESLKLLGGPKE